MVNIRTAPQPTSTRTYPPDSPFTGLFKLEIGTMQLGTFKEVSGLSVQVNLEEITEGGRNDYVHRRPNGFRWPPLILKRGITNNDSLFSWIWETSGEGFAATGNTITPLDGSVTLCDARQQPVRIWAFSKAFPVKWTGPKLATTSTELAVEELEICHHGFRPTPRP